MFGKGAIPISLDFPKSIAANCDPNTSSPPGRFQKCCTACGAMHAAYQQGHNHSLHTNRLAAFFTPFFAFRVSGLFSIDNRLLLALGAGFFKHVWICHAVINRYFGYSFLVWVDLHVALGHKGCCLSHQLRFLRDKLDAIILVGTQTNTRLDGAVWSRKWATNNLARKESNTSSLLASGIELQTEFPITSSIYHW